MTQEKTERGNGDKELFPGGGIVKRVRQTQFPQDILTPKPGFKWALLNAVIRDENYLHKIILYFDQLNEFGMEQEIESEANLLIGTKAISGRASTEALEAYVGIFFPEATVTGKSSKKELDEVLKQRPFRDRKNDWEEDRKREGG